MQSRGPLEDEYALPKMVTFNEALWLFEYGQPYSSEDGKTWRKEVTPPFAPKVTYEVVAFGSALWVIAGSKMEASSPPEVGYPGLTATNEVWRTVDGVEWEQMPSPPFEARQWPSAVEHGGKLFLYGGYSNSRAENLGDVWFTPNGVDWAELSIEGISSPSPRHWPSLFSDERGILVVAGNSHPLMNDVWLLRPSSD